MSLNIKEKHTRFIKTEAKRLGFDYIGISRAEKLNEEAKLLEKWLNKGYQGKMSYLENHFEKRIDPTKLVEGAKSVVTLLYNYETPEKQTDPSAPKISKYAYGEDYHFVIKRKLKELLGLIQDEVGDVYGRCFVDSAPVMERVWAERSGTGWIGKHGLLINKNQGSYFFLAELILDLELESDGPIKDYCGTCTRCIDACPTEAIVGNQILDASKCISYLTIELRESIPEAFKGKMENWMFGCDICQEVCPWNRFAKKHQEPAFEPHPDLLQMTSKDWEEVTDEVFKKVFKKSPVKRTKLEGLKRNIRFLKK